MAAAGREETGSWINNRGVHVRLKNWPIGEQLSATPDTRCPKSSIGSFLFVFSVVFVSCVHRSGLLAINPVPSNQSPLHFYTLFDFINGTFLLTQSEVLYTPSVPESKIF
ncbi:hypothetical protein YC2023_010761 [Brassica napus]